MFRPLRALTCSVCYVLIAASHSAAQVRAKFSDLRPSPEQLAVGSAPGTFAFTYQNSVAFTQEPSFPVKVSLENALRRTIADVEVKDGSPFILTADLVPGSYSLKAEEISGDKASYWPAYVSIFIDSKGKLTYPSLGNSLTLKKKIELLYPEAHGTGIVTETRPVFKWQPLKGAVKYRVWWVAIPPSGNRGPEDSHGAETDATEYRVPEDLSSGLRYQWSVTAVGADQDVLGESVCFNFFTPGGKEAAEKVEKPLPMKSGQPYFGVNHIPIHSERGPNGAIVIAVLPNSPALKAGLEPNDIITAFDGHSLTGVSSTQFVDLVQKVPVGTQVALEFVRGNEKKTAQATIEAKP